MYVVKGKSTKKIIWMGEADSPVEALSKALNFIGEPDDAARYFVVQPIVLAVSIQEKALEWAEEQVEDLGIESMVDALINYAEHQNLHLDWTGFEEE